MNRAMVERHLKETEQHIMLGLKHLTRQHEIIAELRRDGHDTVQAEELLVTLEQSQELHNTTRARILDELGSAT